MQVFIFRRYDPRPCSAEAAAFIHYSGRKVRGSSLRVCHATFAVKLIIASPTQEMLGGPVHHQMNVCPIPGELASLGKPSPPRFFPYQFRFRHLPKTAEKA